MICTGSSVSCRNSSRLQGPEPSECAAAPISRWRAHLEQRCLPRSWERSKSLTLMVGTWALTGQAPVPVAERLCVPVTPPVYNSGHGPVLVYVDLLVRSEATLPLSNSPNHDQAFAGVAHLCYGGEGLLDPESGRGHRGRTRCRHPESGQHALHDRCPPTAALSIPHRPSSRPHAQHSHGSSVRVGGQPRGRFRT